MKKSAIVSGVNIQRMADEFGISQTDLKVALTCSEPTIDTDSIDQIVSLTAARKLYRQAKSARRKQAIAERALDYCETFDDLRLWRNIMFDGNSSVLRGLYFQKLRIATLKSIELASTFDEIHSVWLNCDEDALRAEDLLAYQKMKVIAASTPVFDVINTFFTDIGVEILYAGYGQQYEVILLACKSASPESARDALKAFQGWAWNGEQDTYPVKLLIQKAAQLYPN